MAQKLAMEDKQERTDDELNKIRQQLISAEASVEDKERQSEDARCQLEAVKTEMEELKERLNATHSELNMEHLHVAELQQKILQLQPQEPKSDHCETDVVSALQAQVENLKELLNTAQKELDAQHRCTAELKEKLSELEIERGEAYALSVQDSDKVPEDVVQLSDTTRTELVIVDKMNSTLHSSPLGKQLTELDDAADAASQQVKCEPEDSVEQSGEVLCAVVLKSKYCQTDEMPDDSDELRDKLKMTLDELSSERSEVKLLRQQQEHHLVELDEARNEHLSQLTALNSKHSTDIESVKLAHSAEFEHLREEHGLEMRKHASTLEAEYQRKMAEQKAEMESEAQRSVMLLQEELHCVKDEANAVAESMQQTLTSEFENQLAALKLQFEKDIEEMQCRHAEELEQRDASISDAETVLLKKDERIEELEGELREMQNKLATAVAEYLRKVSEEKIKVESEAQRNVMSLQEELQRVKEEAKTVTESMQETLAKEFEDQLAALKLQFEKDFEEMQCRHADELQQRDASVSDAETVLLKKDERIEELEGQLSGMHSKLALQSDSLHDQLVRLREEHRIEMGKSAATLEAEYQHKMAEQKAEMESEAQRNIVSLREELQRVKDEASAIAESVHRKLSSEFENQLSTLKLQFEKDLKELQCRHAEELEQRDASISDAETVLLKKDQRIEELEEQLREMHNKLATAVAEYQRKVSEEKIKIKSEAQRNVMSLQEELQRMKDEAKTVAESMQQTLTSEFENQLSTLKLQFEKDLKELQCRHAQELQHRDASISDAETVLLKKDQRIEELEGQLSGMHNKLTVQLDSLHSQHAVELQTAETARREDSAKLTMALKEIDEWKQKMAELEREHKSLTVWADHMDENYPRLIATYKDERSKNQELARKLEQSSNDCSKLKAELEKLQHHKCDDSDLRRQLTEEKLRSNALKGKLQKAEDNFDRQRERQTAENDRHEEKVRDLQSTIRQLQDAANNTYSALHHPKPAAAAAAVPEQYAAPPVCESGGFVEKLCLSQMSAKMSELQKKVEVLEEKNVQYKAYILRLRSQREELRGAQKNAKTTSPEAASQLQKQCASVDENVDESGPRTGALNTEGDAAMQKHTASDSAEMVDKISDCKHQ